MQFSNQRWSHRNFYGKYAQPIVRPTPALGFDATQGRVTGKDIVRAIDSMPDVGLLYFWQSLATPIS